MRLSLLPLLWWDHFTSRCLIRSCEISQRLIHQQFVCCLFKPRGGHYILAFSNWTHERVGDRICRGMTVRRLEPPWLIRYHWYGVLLCDFRQDSFCLGGYWVYSCVRIWNAIRIESGCWILKHRHGSNLLGTSSIGLSCPSVSIK